MNTSRRLAGPLLAAALCSLLVPLHARAQSDPLPGRRATTQPAQFFVTINGSGLAGVSDPAWMRTIPELENGLRNVGAALAPKVGAPKLLTLIISSRGVVTSSDQSIVPDGTAAAGLLLQYGKFASALRRTTIKIPGNGTVFWDPPIIFDDYPVLARRVSDVVKRGAAGSNARVRSAAPLELTRLPDGRFESSDPRRLDPRIFDLWDPYSGPSAQRTKYDEFKDCVGEYWYLPGVALVACAIGAGISSAL